MSSLVPDSKILTKGSRVIVTLIGSQNSKTVVSNREKSVVVASTGQENIIWIQSELGLTWYSQRRINASFFSITSAVSKSNQTVRILNTDPAMN
jgi:hypothetical protein